MNMNNYIGKQISKEIRIAVFNALKNSGHYPTMTATILTSEDFGRTGAHIKINNDYLHVVRRFKSTEDFNISPSVLAKMQGIKLCLINSNGVFVVPVTDVLLAVTNQELSLLKQSVNGGTFVHITSNWLSKNNY